MEGNNWEMVPKTSKDRRDKGHSKRGSMTTTDKEKFKLEHQLEIGRREISDIEKKIRQLNARRDQYIRKIAEFEKQIENLENLKAATSDQNEKIRVQIQQERKIAKEFGGEKIVRETMAHAADYVKKKRVEFERTGKIEVNLNKMFGSIVKGVFKDSVEVRESTIVLDESEEETGTEEIGIVTITDNEREKEAEENVAGPSDSNDDTIIPQEDKDE